MSRKKKTYNYPEALEKFFQDKYRQWLEGDTGKCPVCGRENDTGFRPLKIENPASKWRVMNEGASDE